MPPIPLFIGPKSFLISHLFNSEEQQPKKEKETIKFSSYCPKKNSFPSIKTPKLQSLYATCLMLKRSNSQSIFMEAAENGKDLTKF